MRKLLVLFFFLLSFNLYAEIPFFIDFKYVLNESVAGKKAQTALKNKLEKGLNQIREKEKKLREQEKNIINQKKILTPEEYKKKVDKLRTDANNLQKERKKILDDVAKQRTNARNELLKNLNPIIKDYMKGKNIRMVIDKKNLIVADDDLNITEDIVKKLNEKLKSINIK